jgi:hypothetical protein
MEVFAFIGLFALLLGLCAGTVGLLELFSFIRKTNSRLARLERCDYDAAK